MNFDCDCFHHLSVVCLHSDPPTERFRHCFFWLICPRTNPRPKEDHPTHWSGSPDTLVLQISISDGHPQDFDTSAHENSQKFLYKGTKRTHCLHHNFTIRTLKMHIIPSYWAGLRSHSFGKLWILSFPGFLIFSFWVKLGLGWGLGTEWGFGKQLGWTWA